MSGLVPQLQSPEALFSLRGARSFLGLLHHSEKLTSGITWSLER